MSGVCVRGRFRMGTGGLNLATDTIKALIYDTTSSIPIEPGKPNLAAYTTLGRFDGSGYADVLVTGLSVEEDVPGNQVKWATATVHFPSVGPGTNLMAGVLFYKFVASDADSEPIEWVDQFFPRGANGGDVDVPVPSGAMVW